MKTAKGQDTIFAGKLLKLKSLTKSFYGYLNHIG
jgi:hypothetical protein